MSQPRRYHGARHPPRLASRRPARGHRSVLTRMRRVRTPGRADTLETHPGDGGGSRLYTDGHRISSGDIRRHCPLRVHTRQSLAGRAGARDRCTTRRAARRSRKRPTRHRRRNRRSVKHRCAETMRDSPPRRAVQIFQRTPRRHCAQVCRYISTHARVYVRRWPPALPAAPAPNFLAGALCSPCPCAAVHRARV